MNPTPTTELVVLLDDDGQHLGSASKHEVHREDTPLHLAFSCYVFDTDGRLLVTRRALGKRTWPGVWSNSCCGHPAPGEDGPDAVHRRVWQELGITLENLRTRLPDFRYRATDVTGTVENELCPVYTAVTRDRPRVAPDEIADWAWSEWDEFVRIAERAPWLISPWAAQQAPLLTTDIGGAR